MMSFEDQARAALMQVFSDFPALADAHFLQQGRRRAAVAGEEGVSEVERVLKLLK
jgi:hypothetical protein